MPQATKLLTASGRYVLERELGLAARHVDQVTGFGAQGVHQLEQFFRFLDQLHTRAGFKGEARLVSKCHVSQFGVCPLIHLM